jgi:hypothetical protein
MAEPLFQVKWAIDFSMVVALPLLYGNNAITNIQQVTTGGDRQIYNPLYRYTFKKLIYSMVWCEAYVMYISPCGTTI